MSEKKVGKRLLTWVLVLVMTLSLLPLNVLAEYSTSPASILPPDTKCITYVFYNGETKVDEQIIKTGDTLLEPEIGTQPGKRLKGWYTAQENGDLFTDFGNYTSEITENTTISLYARFEDVYYVYFKDTTGRIVATKEGKSGDEISVDDVKFPVGNDESITGWYLEGDSGKTAVTSVTLDKANVTLCAIVEKGHWITFESDGGSYVAPQFVRSGESCKAPSDPTKPGYDFVGWYTDEETNDKFEFGNTLSDNPTLYAKWTPSNRVSYTVIHWWENANDDGYSFHERETKYGKVGDPTIATAKTYSITDKSLTGQSITRKNVFSPQAIEQQTIKNDGSTIVNIYYKRAEYKLSFGYYQWNVLWTEWKEIASITKKYGENISSSEWPKNGSQANWKIDNSEKYIAYLSTMPLDGGRLTRTSDEGGENTATYYVETLNGSESGAICVDNRWFIVHHYDKTKGTSGNTVGPEDRYAITGFEPISNLGTQVGKKYKNAKFYYSRSSYDIVYVNTGAKDNDKHTVSYKFEAPISDAGNYKPTTTPAGKDGYIFDGWYDAPAGGSRFDFTNKTMPAQNITVYAKWVAPVHKVEFVVENNTVDAYTKDNVPHNSTISDLPTPKSSTGDTFLGWVDANGKPFHPSTKITGDLKLYAKFGNKSGYSVTYVTAEGSSSVTDDKLYAEGAYATVRDGASTAPAGKVFLYWTDGNTVYYPNSKVTINGNVTLTAVYGDTAQPVSITYHSNFNDASKTYDTLANNEKITVMGYSATDLPDREGYTFAGWNTNPNGTGDTFAAGTDARVDNDGENHLYAQWTINQYNYTVQYYYDGQINDSQTVTSSADFESTISTYPDKKLPGYKLEKTENFPLTISATAENNVIKVYYVKDSFGYTIEYYYDGQINDSQTVTSSADFESTISTYPDKNLPGYKLEKTENFPLTISATAENNVIKVYYVTDPDQKHNLSYTVEYYKDGVKVEADTQAVRKPVQVLETTLPVDKSEINTTNKYNGYKFEKTDPTTIPDTVNDGATIKVYYVTDPDQTKTLSYTVEYYKDGVKVEADTQTVPQTVQVLQPDTLTVDKNAINTTDKYTGYKFDKTDPTMIPDTVNDGATIKVYYVKDSFTVIWLNWNGDLLEKDEDVKYNSDPSYDGKSPTRPASGRYTYTFNGWTPALSPVTDDITYTATYKSTYHRPSTPTKPTVEIEDDDALGLNTTDHFAYIVGYGNGEVRPQNNITRAEVATIFFRLLTDDVRDENLTKTNRYSDVTRADWYNTAVSTLSSMGIITGYPDGTFRPNAAITRAEFAAIAARFDSNGDKTTAKFSDIASHWAKDEISIAYNNGWITGYPNGTFGPQRDITRAETMTLVNRVLNRQPETEEDLLPNMTVWTDNANPKAWYYLAVQEATNSHYYEFKTNSQYEKWTELRETRDWTLLEK